jgi:hypothetical protein
MGIEDSTKFLVSANMIVLKGYWIPAFLRIEMNGSTSISFDGLKFVAAYVPGR